VRSVGHPRYQRTKKTSDGQSASQVHERDKRIKNRNNALRNHEAEVQGVQCDKKTGPDAIVSSHDFGSLIGSHPYLVFQFPPSAGQRTNRRMYRSQIFPRQVQNEIEISSSAVPPGWPGTQTHLLTVRSLQHCSRPTMYQETNGHANIHHD
jgi:hypothetical protein